MGVNTCKQTWMYVCMRETRQSGMAARYTHIENERWMWWNSARVMFAREYVSNDAWMWWWMMDAIWRDNKGRGELRNRWGINPHTRQWWAVSVWFMMSRPLPTRGRIIRGINISIVYAATQMHGRIEQTAITQVISSHRSDRCLVQSSSSSSSCSSSYQEYQSIQASSCSHHHHQQWRHCHPHPHLQHSLHRQGWVRLLRLECSCCCDGWWRSEEWWWCSWICFRSWWWIWGGGGWRWDDCCCFISANGLSIIDAGMNRESTQMIIPSITSETCIMIDQWIQEVPDTENEL